MKTLLLAFLLAGPASAAPRYDVLLISLGNVGAGHMSLYGYGRPTTPRLDAWAKDAVVFENAFSPASWTLPVGTSLFTSLYPFAHGVTARGARNLLRPEVPTLPEILRSTGYATGAFAGGLDYYKGFGHMRGFETAPENPDFSGYGTTIPQAREWLAANAGRPAFAFVHGYDAHCPFRPSASARGAFARDASTTAVEASGECLRGVEDAGGYRVEAGPRCELDRGTLECREGTVGGRRRRALTLTPADVAGLRDLYDESVLGVDEAVGGFLASLSSATLARTIVIVYCEHGEMFGKHGRFGRPGAVRGAFYDDVLHVPLIVRVPGVPGRRVGALVELTDVMPTVLALLGLPAPAGLQGRDLGALLAGGDAPVHGFVHAGMNFDLGRPREPNDDKEVSAIRDREWKLIREIGLPGRRGRGAPSVSLFRVADDPDEKTDLAQARPEVAARLLRELARWRRDCLAVRRSPLTKEVPPELLRHARERGYW